jgi:hypothetical protein
MAESSRTAIDKFYDEAKAAVQLLQQEGELSLQVTAADNFRKALLLASASYFEHRVCQAVLEFVRRQSSNSVLIENFVRNKAISRQYHTWFSWEASNANQFFGLFGAEFKVAMTARLNVSKSLREAIQAFMELGRERNRLVHENFAVFQMDKTMDEIYALYQHANQFVEAIFDHLVEFSAVTPDVNSAAS